MTRSGGITQDGNLYGAFTGSHALPSRGFTGTGADSGQVKGGINMGDFISIVFGVVIFTLLIVYVPACEKV